VKAKRIRVRRRLEGRHEIVEAPLPAMIAVVREINRPRYPTVPGALWQGTPRSHCGIISDGIKRRHYRLKGSATQVRKIFSPLRERGEIIGNGVNNPEEASRLLIDRLIEKGLLSL